MSINLEQQARALIRAENLINGQWVAAASGRRVAVTDPATGKLIAEVVDSGPADARAAADAAATALPAWRATLPKERAAILRRWHALIVEQQDALAALISLEQGKPLAEGRGEVAYGAGAAVIVEGLSTSNGFASVNAFCCDVTFWPLQRASQAQQEAQTPRSNAATHLSTAAIRHRNSKVHNPSRQAS